jgi:hypothetical protein
LNPYAFTRITLEDWCIAAERFMIKQTLGVSKWKGRVVIIQKLDDWSTRSNWRTVNVLAPLTLRRYNYLTSVEFSPNKQQFYRSMNRKNRTGPIFGGDSSLRYHIASFLFSPTASTTSFNNGGDDEEGFLSTAEANLLPHFPVVAAVGSRSPSCTGVLASWNKTQLADFCKRVTVQRCRVDFHLLRHLTHKNLKDATTTNAKLLFMNKERWGKGELTNQMSMLGTDRYYWADECLPIIVVGSVGGHNAIFASVGLRACTPLSGNTFRIRLSADETLKDIARQLALTNAKIAKINKYQPPLFLALYLEAGEEAIWRHKDLPSISMPGATEKQVIDITEDEVIDLGGGIVYVAGLSATLHLDYITSALKKLGICETHKPAWATTITDLYDEEVVYIEVDVRNVDETSGKTFMDNKKDVHVNVLRGSEMPLGYKVIERVPVYDDGSTNNASTGKPNLVPTAAEDLILRMVCEGHGWNEGARSPAANKSASKKNKRSIDEEDAGTGERKDRVSSASGKTGTSTTPPTTLLDKISEEDEVVEGSPKRLNYDEGGNSADEDMEADADEETSTNDNVVPDPEEIEAYTLERIKGKLQVLDDFLSIFEKSDNVTPFNPLGASEEQIDDRIAELTLILSLNVLKAKGTKVDLAEAHRMNNDLTCRLGRLSFLRPRKRRPATDDGQTEDDASLKGDPNHNEKKVVTAKRRRPAPKHNDPLTAPITNYFSSPAGKKPIPDSPISSSLGGLPGVCGFCSAAKETECGICQAPLCEKHSLEHAHGAGRAANGMNNKIRRVSFPEMGPSLPDDSETTTLLHADIDKMLMDDENQELDHSSLSLNEP